MSFFRPPVRDIVAARVAGLTTASSLALLAGCAPDLGPLAKIKPAAGYATQKALGEPTQAAWPGQDWWTAYKDPQLTTLIEEALKGSPDLKAAEARLHQAEALSEQAGAALGPTLNASGNIQETAVKLNAKGIPSQLRTGFPSNIQPFTQLGAKFAYQLDFFGKNHAAVAAASSQQKAAEFEMQAARLQISTSVASAYAELVRLTADRQATLDAVKVRGDTLKLVSDRVKNGLENQGQQAQSSAERNVSLGDVATLDARIDQTRHRLAALVGAGPDRGLDIAPNPASVGAPWGLPSNLPADLIGRRADVAAARLRAEAAADHIEEARADFYPNVSLTASTTDLAFTPDQIFNHEILLAQAGPAVTLPIFQGGRLKGAYRGAAAEYQEAVAAYDKAVANALKEVADAVSDRRALAIQLDYAQKALADSRKAYDLAVLRYKGGLAPYLVVLTAESTLIAQQRAAADLNVQALAANIALVGALGGGFTGADIAQIETKSSNERGPAHG